MRPVDVILERCALAPGSLFHGPTLPLTTSNATSFDHVMSARECPYFRSKNYGAIIFSPAPRDILLSTKNETEIRGTVGGWHDCDRRRMEKRSFTTSCWTHNCTRSPPHRALRTQINRSYRSEYIFLKEGFWEVRTCVPNKATFVRGGLGVGTTWILQHVLSPQTFGWRRVRVISQTLGVGERKGETEREEQRI